MLGTWHMNDTPGISPPGHQAQTSTSRRYLLNGPQDGHSTGIHWVFLPPISSFLRQRHRPKFLSLDLFYYVNKGRRFGSNMWEDKIR